MATQLDNVEVGTKEKEREMFQRIAESNATVKSQQIDEKDLTTEEKIAYLNEIYHQNPVTILQKFGPLLNSDDLELFNNEQPNYEINFYVKKFRKLLDPSNKERIVKNRRFNYLNNVLKDSDYFDENELEKRNPFMYKQYVGQYVSYNELERNKEQNFSDFLFSKIDKDLNEFRCDLEQRVCDTEEFDESSDDDQDNEFKKYLEDEVPMEREERTRLHKEFICLVENDFLAGDTNFDYSNVDNTEEYDNVTDQDIEDHYFDLEEACEETMTEL